MAMGECSAYRVAQKSKPLPNDQKCIDTVNVNRFSRQIKE